ncbi:redox-sensing transcriptional repressor Rex [Acidiferrimicrobium sp. IK]|uniref:redox-sensing transcriptional repressor Rex n=1 Tax=Acidiferrimicrobium sp. IK TaxID=2871700 RepID=UPI0021CB509B|nr:redox-sensing transcriptional repressor Rex [Acidiferrimicrobium sp. IK]
MTQRRVPEATVARLPVYLRALMELSRDRTATVSSEDLALLAGVNAAQVRKDLSHLGSYGVRGVGYEVDYLIRQVNRELGLTGERAVAIVGVGNLGRALANYDGFRGRGFEIVAAFDTDPGKVGRNIGPVAIQPASELTEVCRQRRVAIGVVTTPSAVAQEMTDRLVGAGVVSILNFAPVVLQVPPHVTLRQVDLGVELQILGFYERQAAERQPADREPTDSDQRESESEPPVTRSSDQQAVDAG